MVPRSPFERLSVFDKREPQSSKLRTGWNPQEATLTPDAVRQFGFGVLKTFPVQGEVYAQPLYIQNVGFPDGSASDVVLIATEEDRIYGFDAYAWVQKWTRQLLPSGKRLVMPADLVF